MYVGRRTSRNSLYKFLFALPIKQSDSDKQ